MGEEPFYIVLKNVKEHENGDATYTFDMSDKVAQSVIEEGLKLMMYCGISKVDLQDVYNWILKQGEKNEDAT